MADLDSEGARHITKRSRKSSRAFRTISEVSKALNIPQHVLRFWETKFSQIKPMKRGGGRRYYRPEDVLILERIKDLLYIDGYTIKGVQKLFREQGIKKVIASEGEAIAQQQQSFDQQKYADRNHSDVETRKEKRSLGPRDPVSHINQISAQSGTLSSLGQIDRLELQSIREELYQISKELKELA